MTGRAPVEYRIGDRLRLRKVHPCGGWTWEVVRLGADIGLVCETCARRILLDRSTLERRTKSFLSRGPDAAGCLSSDSATSEPIDFRMHIPVGLVLRPTHAVTARLLMYFTSSSTETSSVRLDPDDEVRVSKSPTQDDLSITLEPIEYERFEREYVPGGIRSRESYEGCAMSVDWQMLVRDFEESAAPSEIPAPRTPDQAEIPSGGT